jgi:hypothetical protein
MTGRAKLLGRLGAPVLLAILALALPASAPAAVGPATINPSGKAVAPKGAPKFVKQMIDAGNRIRRKPYVWGGGHGGKWQDRGYDCSGAVSYVLHAAGLLDYSLVSGDFMKYGNPGTSRWVSIYANKEHVFMEVAGLRYDTSYITDGDKSGPGWSEILRERKGFRVRHPAGV